MRRSHVRLRDQWASSADVWHGKGPNIPSRRLFWLELLAMMVKNWLTCWLFVAEKHNYNCKTQTPFQHQQYQLMSNREDGRPFHEVLREKRLHKWISLLRPFPKPGVMQMKDAGDNAKLQCH